MKAGNLFSCEPLIEGIKQEGPFFSQALRNYLSCVPMNSIIFTNLDRRSRRGRQVK